MPLTDADWIRRAERQLPVPAWKLRSLLLEEREAIDALSDAGGAEPDQVVYTTGAFVPATTGTFPNNYAHTGIAFDKASIEKACMPLLVPSSWETPVISILGLAATFQSGNVVFRLGPEDGDNDVVVTVAGSYLGELDFPTPLSWNAGSGALAGLQFSQLPLSRVGDDAADTLNDDFAVLAVIVTPGS